MTFTTAPVDIFTGSSCGLSGGIVDPGDSANTLCAVGSNPVLVSVPKFNQSGFVLDSVDVTLNWISHVAGTIDSTGNGTPNLNSLSSSLTITISEGPGGNSIMAATVNPSWRNLDARLPYTVDKTAEGSNSALATGDLSNFIGVGNTALSVGASGAVFSMTPNDHRTFIGQDYVGGTLVVTYNGHGHGQLADASAPEPASMALVGSVLCIAAALARRKRP
jgi:hypothetical protein